MEEAAGSHEDVTHSATEAHPSKAEIAKRIAAFDACRTKQPLAMAYNELREQRLSMRDQGCIE